MPRTARASAANVCYHVLNRGNAQQTVFHDAEDYAAFVRLLNEASDRLPMRLLAWCLMPNHFHLVLWPHDDGDLSRWMQWLLTSHVRRYHRTYQSSGHVWQGRFKAFPVQEDDHLYSVLRYVERNPVRAKTIPVRKAARWPWSSAGTVPSDLEAPMISKWPVPRPRKWASYVDEPQTEAELLALRHSIARGAPYGDSAWSEQTAIALGLEASLRPRGRPRKAER